MAAAVASQMMLGSGMCGNKDQAEMMATKFKEMNPSHMEFLVKLASVAQAMYQKWLQFKEQPLLVLGAVLLLVALLLRWFGIL